MRGIFEEIEIFLNFFLFFFVSSNRLKISGQTFKKNTRWSFLSSDFNNEEEEEENDERRR